MADLNYIRWFAVIRLLVLDHTDRKSRSIGVELRDKSSKNREITARK